MIWLLDQLPGVAPTAVSSTETLLMALASTSVVDRRYAMSDAVPCALTGAAHESACRRGRAACYDAQTMKKNRAKLVLKSETVRVLNDDRLVGVLGGARARAAIVGDSDTVNSGGCSGTVST